jgi:hypothetical protein
VLALAAGACSKKSEPASVLQSEDLVAAGAPFDVNEILDSASMQDDQSLDAPQIQQFLARSPYGGASFLASYESNGVPAAQAIVRAAQRYRINPLVLLVHAQADQGLVGAGGYPSPSSRVEFAFGCGCAAAGACDPAYAGFDVQVGCLAQTLRDSLDQIGATGATAGGWGPNATTVTTDGVPVTPHDDSTAALYEYTPVVAVGHAGGTWLLWNLWQKYSVELSYGGPIGSVTPPAWIGGPCGSDAACDYGSVRGKCATQYKGGLCTLACTQTCPSAPGEAPTFCAALDQQGGSCLEVCNPGVPQCRDGYVCKSVKQAGSATTSQFVCFPQ